jgi:pimeloyl-ACP methyl ester carboxylesterase
MSPPRRNPATDLRGAARLAVETTRGVSGIVLDMQGPTLGIAGLVHAGLRGVTRLVGYGVDASLAPLVPLLDGTRTRPGMEAALGVLNGVVGDHLAATGNPLALGMELRHAGEPLEPTRAGIRSAIPGARGRIVVLVHGSCMSDRGWLRRGHDHGAALERDLAVTALHLRYNSGLHVSENGRELSGLLERVVRAWPVPVEEVVLLAHSMGGLVCRSACHQAEREGRAWRRRLGRMIFLGTPHHGAPAERAGNWVNVVLAAAPFTGPLSRLPRIRSAGVTDLRHGNLLDEDWQGRDRFRAGPDPRRPVPLPRGVKCHAIAASLARDASAPPRGDGLVPLDSALGRHPDRARDLRFPASRRWIAHGAGHLDLLDRQDVYDRIRRWISAG